ncbi:hypothetical protein [Clostridium paraputrificum]|uniref:hypothetical protein n=1 Tax=Clostridium paraputrificum TaxID=29363 RepID=UPI00189DE334|nr:hypothetical protein [Clostridium paraputrificum]
MSKQLNSSRYILKIRSSRLRMNNWNLDITLAEAKKNEELISLGDSQLLRFIREITNMNYSELQIKEVKSLIKNIKKEENTKENREKIKELYSKLDEMLYIKDYIAIVFDKKSDFDRATSKKKFKINGITYKRILGTTGGIKKNTIMFCSEKIYNELNNKLENDRDENIPLVPAKYEAYKALSASVSTPVSKPKGVLVIKDGVTHIKDKVIMVSDNGNGGFKVDKDVDYETDKEFCDGCGIILPSLAEKWAIDLGLYTEDNEGNKQAKYIPSGFNTRFSFEKGMVGTFEADVFAETIAHNYMVEDAWGDLVDIRDVELIITTNMLKLWNSYSSIDDYLKKSYDNGYDWCVTKVCPEELEDIRNTNYQYLQSFEMSDEDIDEFIYPTVNDIKGVLGGDINKTILFSKGVHINNNSIDNSEYDYIRALMIEPKMMEDSYVKQNVYRLIEKKIKEAKKGVLKIKGNYSIIFNDLYALCESMFKMPIKGLLKAGEFYSEYWNSKDIDEILAFRSPMTSHNNIRKLKIVHSHEILKWYKYMKTVVIFNAWDTTNDAMNGADYDSDSIITTDNEVLLRNFKPTQTIVCQQNPVGKIRVTESQIKKTNKNGFGDDIGTITNRVTAMFDVLAGLEKDSIEYNELFNRIIQGQAYQQESIDRIKGIIAKSMPKEWYDYKSLKIKEDDSYEIKRKKEENIKIMVNKKPYFFIYNYEHLLTQYKTFVRDTDNNCIIRYGLTVNELKEKEYKTEDEEKFLRGLKYKSPVFDNPCIMNKICHRLEDEFKNVKLKIKEDTFDKELLKTSKKYDKLTYAKVEEIYKDYKTKLRQFGQSSHNNKGDREQRLTFIMELKERAFMVCNDEELLCNILVDICYKTKNNRALVWQLCGEQIIKNLLQKHNNTYRYPIPDKNGTIEYNGQLFEVKEYKAEEVDE